jgi:hypothetical protein
LLTQVNIFNCYILNPHLIHVVHLGRNIGSHFY